MVVFTIMMMMIIIIITSPVQALRACPRLARGADS